MFTDYQIAEDNTNPLNKPLLFTKFDNKCGTRKTEQTASLREMKAAINSVTKAEKGLLPLWKLALFGDRLSLRGSLRHDANVLSISGIVADYDLEEMSLETAASILRGANVAGLVYTSPSHTPQKPRWRVMCPCSAMMDGSHHTRLVASLNGLFGGVLAGESFTLSQAYYYGKVSGTGDRESHLIDGRFIDECDELDEGAIGTKRKERPTAHTAPFPSIDGEGTEAGLSELARYCAAIEQAEEGDKWAAVNRSSYAVGGLVASGAVGKDTAEAALRTTLDTIKDRCKHFDAACDTMMVGFEDGLKVPLATPQQKLADGFAEFTIKLTSADLVELALSDFLRDNPAATLAACFDHLIQLGSDIGDWIFENFAVLEALYERLRPSPKSKSDQKTSENKASADNDDADFSDTDTSRINRYLARATQIDEIEVSGAGPYIVKNLIKRGQVVGVIGHPGAGKSLLAPYIAYAVAQGRSIFGKRVRQCKSLIAAAEDFGGLKHRMLPLKSQYGDAPELTVTYIENLLNEGEARDFQNYIKDEEFEFVIIDTMGAAWAGVDENTAEGMGKVVAFCRRIANTGATVVLVHHTAKSGDGGARGHSVLNGILDATIALEIDLKTKIVSSKLLKNRNGTTDLDMSFRLSVMHLGIDEDGDNITAPYACELSAHDRPIEQPKMTQQELLAIQALEQTIKRHGIIRAKPDGTRVLMCRAADWQQRYLELRSGEARDTALRGFRRVKIKLQTSGRIDTSNDYVWLIGADMSDLGFPFDPADLAASS